VSTAYTAHVTTRDNGAAVLDMLAERMAGRPPLLPPPTRREEPPEPVEERDWAMWLTPFGGPSQRVVVRAACRQQAVKGAADIGKVRFPMRTFTVSVGSL